MSITILGEGDTLRLLQSDTPIPEGELVILFTKEEMSQQIQDGSTYKCPALFGMMKRNYFEFTRSISLYCLALC